MKPTVSLSSATIVSHCKSLHPVLRDVSFDVAPGEVLYILGRVGSGKSSLLGTLYGEIPLMGGSGVVCGISLSGLSPRLIPQLRRRMGIIFQEPMLITTRTVWDNLEFLLRSTRQLHSASAISSRIDAILDIVGMRWSAMRFAGELSGGEAQKIAIARALLLQPPLIIADEPTGNLDPASAQTIIGILHDVAQMGSSVIIASHNIDNVRKSGSRAIMCDHGASAHPVIL